MILNDINSNISVREKQRIAIARLLLQDTELILLDEITSSLDKENSYLIYSIMKKISKVKLLLRYLMIQFGLIQMSKKLI